MRTLHARDFRLIKIRMHSNQAIRVTGYIPAVAIYICYRRSPSETHFPLEGGTQGGSHIAFHSGCAGGTLEKWITTRRVLLRRDSADAIISPSGAKYNSDG